MQTSKVTLHPHQSAGGLAIIATALINKSRGFLLGDETGLGKTFTALYAFSEMLRLDPWGEGELNRLLVVCPATLTDHWLATARLLGIPEDKITVTSYQSLPRFFKKEVLPNKQISWIPQRFFPLQIYDESQRLRHYTSRAYKLYCKLSDQSRFVLLLSATPLQDPLEAAYLKPIIGFQEFFGWVQRNFTVFKKFNAFSWQENSEDMDKLHRLVFGQGRALRRRVTDIAGWPKQQIELFPLKLTPKERALYTEFDQKYRILRKQGGERASLQALGALVQVRQTLSIIKALKLIPVVKEWVESGYKVAVYTECLAALRLLADKLGDKCCVLYGDILPKDRPPVLQRFRTGDATSMIFTIPEGINLEQPDDKAPERVQFNLDVPWSGISAIQVNGRCHRNGRRAAIYNCFVQESLDERVVARMTQRCRSIACFNGDPVELLKMEAAMPKDEEAVEQELWTELQS